MSEKNKIYEQGLEKYSKYGIIIENLALIFWIILGAIATCFIHPLIAWFYLIFAIVMVMFVLRKLLCVNCYYYDKWCHVGWGKLTALFFKKGDITKFNSGIGQKLAPLTYGLLILVPLILIIISLIQEFSVFKLTILILLILTAFYSSVIARKKSCAKCKMKLCCQGCAVKNYE